MAFLAPVAGQIATGLAGSLGASAAQSILGGGANKAAQSTRFTPFNISTSLGQTGMRDGNLFAQLSPELQGAQGQLFGGAGKAFANWKGFDPNAAAADAYGRMAAIAAPGEQQARSQLENRLFAQGRLGTTGGAQQFGQFMQAQNMADLARQQGAVELGQQLQAGILQQGLGALQGGVGLQEGLFRQLGLGTDAAYQRSAANQFGAQAQLSAAENRAGMVSGFWDQLSGPIGNAVSNVFTPTGSPSQMSNPFNPYWT